MKYIITYDIRGEKNRYEKLYEIIDAISNDWSRPCESTWIIDTNFDIETVSKRISGGLRSRDSFVVAGLSGDLIYNAEEDACEALDRIFDSSKYRK